MIVVVIIGLLAAMAIPAFQQVRENAVGKAMTNDARQLASGAQQYMLENSLTQVTFAITADDWCITGDLINYVAKVGKNTTGPTVSTGYNFTLSHPQFEDEAQQ